MRARYAYKLLAFFLVLFSAYLSRTSDCFQLWPRVSLKVPKQDPVHMHQLRSHPYSPSLKLTIFNRHAFCFETVLA